ncbi:MAG: hypothetical protein EXR75_16415, partial [Myxococcales bacterium]|nr:hypothetical protein [Myxococcales bacterium]
MSRFLRPGNTLRLRLFSARRRRPWGSVLLAVVALIVSSACSLAIEGNLTTVRCTDEGAYGEPACAGGQTCVGGVCALVGAPVGHACGLDAECASPGSCVSGQDVGLGSSRRCAVPCCTSAECGPASSGNVCRQLASGGGSLCWPASALEGVAAPGDGEPGASCTAAEQCRAGMCEGGRCLDSCCADSTCTGTERVCRAGGNSEAPGWHCGSPPSDKSSVGKCTADNDCRTGVCVTIGEPADDKLCLAHCCSSAECGSLKLKSMGSYLLTCTVDADGVRGCLGRVALEALLGVGAACNV